MLGMDKAIWEIRYLKWSAYALAIVALIIGLIIDTQDNRYRLVSLSGLFAFIIIAFVFSKNPAKIKWLPVIWGLVLQLVIAVLVLRIPAGLYALMWFSDQIVKLLDYTYVGTDFVFGFLSKPPNICGMSPVFIFSILQVIVFFSSLVSILYYYGITQRIFKIIAKFMEFTMGTTAIESLFAACCIFLGSVEAGVLVQPYLPLLTRSEVHQIMTSGYACIAGVVFAAYVSFGACPIYLLSASVMSAPAALTISKLFYPETEVSKTKSMKGLKLEESKESNVIEAISNGACNAVVILANIGANVIAFMALIALLNSALLYSYLFFPFAFLMGASDHPDWDIRMKETMAVAELIGTKTIINDFIAYKKMGDYVLQGRIEGRAQMIATFALCGFSNLGHIGIQVATLASACPHQKHVYPEIAIRALVAGSIACFMTATFAGLLVSNPIVCNPTIQSGNCFDVNFSTSILDVISNISMNGTNLPEN